MENYVILPTYREAKNLVVLLPMLKNFKVVVVDDNSRDGTSNICKRFRNVKLITRKEKLGVSSAVLAGINSINGDEAKIVVMDADLQHDPKKLPEFFSKLKTNDFVYGSRRNIDMPIYRKAISKTGKFIAKTLVPQTAKINDPMSGYFGFRKGSVNLKNIRPIGYKLMLDCLANLKTGSKIAEVKYDFDRRRYGKSKLGLGVILAFLMQTIKLNNYRIILFGLVGLSGIFVNEVVAFLLHPYLPLYLVFTLSTETAVLTNFTLNHNITFKRRVALIRSLPRYNLVALAGLVLNVAIAVYLSIFISYLLANLIGILSAFGFNYILSEKFAWRTYE